MGYNPRMTTKLHLRSKHALFVAELMADPNREPGPAYARAYEVDEGPLATSCGKRLLGRPDVAAEVARLQKIEDERKGISRDEVVREITLLAKADPRGIFDIYRGCCRYCYGQGHKYQRTPREFRDAWAKYLTDEHSRDPDGIGLYFNHEGGVGYNRRTPPNPECPECFGDGETHEVLKDSREWTDAAARLFAGFHRTKDGLRVTTRNQDKALQLAAQMHRLLTVDGADGDDDGTTPPPSEINYEAKNASKPGRKR